MNARFEYDPRADAAYIEFDENTEFSHQVNLDDSRVVDYGVNGSVIGVELLHPGEGVLLDGLPFAEEISRILAASGFRALATAG